MTPCGTSTMPRGRKPSTPLHPNESALERKRRKYRERKKRKKDEVQSNEEDAAALRERHASQQRLVPISHLLSIASLIQFG